MFLRSTIRRKDGKEHRYWSIVENRRLRDSRVVQRAVLYLGERLSWNHFVGFGFLILAAFFIFKR